MILIGMLIGKLADSVNREKIIDRELIQAKNDTENANKLIKEFLANISHEIRTPMNSIIGYATLLKDDEDDLQKQNKLDIILHAGNILLNLINELLDFSRIEAGEIFLEPTDFSINEFFGSIQDIFTLKAKEKNLSFTISHAKTPQFLYGDERRIQQIIINLVSNAIKFTQEGSVSLDYSWKKGILKIRVSDTGIGIPEEQCLSIFSAFKQVDSVFTRQHGGTGTGLGLTITKKLVDLMQGEISIESTIGEGSTFTVFLPLPEVELKDTVDAKKDYISKDTKNLETADDLKNYNTKKFIKNLKDMKLSYKVLIAEDDRLTQDYFAELLYSLDVHFDIAEDGEVVIEKLSESIKNDGEPFDLLLLDIKMPRMGGLEVMEYIHSTICYKELKVFAVTGYTKEDDSTMYRNAGFDAYLSKPVNKKDFLNKVIPLIMEKHGVTIKKISNVSSVNMDNTLLKELKLSHQKKIELRTLISKLKKSYEIFDPQEIQRLGEELKKIVPAEHMSYFLEQINFAIKNYDDEILRKLIIEMEEANV